MVQTWGTIEVIMPHQMKCLGNHMRNMRTILPSLQNGRLDFQKCKKNVVWFWLNCLDLLKFGILPPQEVKRLMNHIIVIKCLTLNNALLWVVYNRLQLECYTWFYGMSIDMGLQSYIGFVTIFFFFPCWLQKQINIESLCDLKSS